MFAWFKRSPVAAENPDLAAYKAIRAASQTWFSKVMAHPASQRFDMLKAARKAGFLMEDRSIVFEDESEMPVLMDYFLFDYRPDGKSVAESCVFARGELTPLEAEFHRAGMASPTSLFAVAAVHPQEPKILLRDRLNADPAEFWLTDFALSDSFRRGGGEAFLFTRAIATGGLHLTGGFCFVFAAEHEAALVEGYRRAMRSVPEALRARRRTPWFLSQHRKFGIPQFYEDVVPPADKTARRSK